MSAGKHSLLVELYLDTGHGLVTFDHVWTREIPPRGARLRPVPRGVRTAIASALDWTLGALNECEQTPYTCARQSNGRRTRSLCPACRIRKALGMPELRPIKTRKREARRAG